MRRKIKLVFDKEKLNLPNEIINDSVEVIVEADEGKNLYQNLSTNPFIIDWDFVDEKEENKEIITSGNSEESFNPDPDTTTKINDLLLPEEKLADLIIKEFDISSYNELATLLETILIVGYNSPALRFDEFLFLNQIKTKYLTVASQPISSEHALCKLILESYYSGLSNIREALIDVILKLMPLWKEKKVKEYPTLASLTYKLFKKNN